MKYRQRKNSLSASMKTVVDVFTKEELIEHIEKTWNSKVATIRFEHGIFDPRIQWDAHNVAVTFTNKPTKEFLVGISDGQF